MFEKERNLALRRADWRFLLPTASIGRAVCFGEGELSDAVRLVASEFERAETAREGQADVVVAVNPDRATLLRMRAILRPGGTAYTEWASPGSTPARIARDLRSSGFLGVHLYHPHSGQSRYDAWIPIKGTRALSYAARVSVDSDRRTTRLLRDKARRIGLFVAMSTGMIRPICAVAQADGHNGAGEPEFVGSLRRAGVPVDSARSPGSAPWMLITAGQRSINKVIGVVFEPEMAEAAYVVKMPRVPESLAGLRNEAASLTAIQARHPGARRAAPKLISLREKPSPLVSESAIRGVPLFTILRRVNYSALASIVTTWLCDLGAVRTTTDEGAWARLMRPIFDDFALSFAPVLDRESLDFTRGVLKSSGPLPVVMEHRDMGPWNLFIENKSELHVLDWESSEQNGLPVLDLLYFLAHTEMFLAGAFRYGTETATYIASSKPASFTGSVRERCIERYCDALQLDGHELRSLKLFVWLLHARSEYSAFVADTGGPPSSEMLLRSRFLRLWRAEVGLQQRAST